MSEENLSEELQAQLINFFKSVLSEVESTFGIAGFFNKLTKEDDWSIVIKLHAMLESVLSEFLCEALQRPELRDIWTNLPMGEKDYGKVVILSKLQLLSKQSQKYLERLSELRNQLAHRVSNVNFTFDKFLSEMDKHKRRSFLAAMISEEIDLPLQTRQKLQLAPAKAVAMGACGVLMEVKVLKIKLQKERTRTTN